MEDSPYNWHWAAVRALAGALMQQFQIEEPQAREIIAEARQAWFNSNRDAKNQPSSEEPEGQRLGEESES